MRCCILSWNPTWKPLLPEVPRILKLAWWRRGLYLALGGTWKLTWRLVHNFHFSGFTNSFLFKPRGNTWTLLVPPNQLTVELSPHSPWEWQNNSPYVPLGMMHNLFYSLIQTSPNATFSSSQPKPQQNRETQTSSGFLNFSVHLVIRLYF